VASAGSLAAAAARSREHQRAVRLEANSLEKAWKEADGRLAAVNERANQLVAMLTALMR